jgi:hypothetical protein
MEKIVMYGLFCFLMMAAFIKCVPNFGYVINVPYSDGNDAFI